MPATNPDQLVEEFQKSGEFDRLRRELFAEFQKGNHIPSFNKKTEDVVQQRFASMKTKSFLSSRFNKNESNLRTELLQEIQRYPYVETTVNDLPIFSDKIFDENLKDSVMRILKEEPTANENHQDLKEKEVDDKQLDSPKDSRLSDYKREEDDALDEFIDHRDASNGEHKDGNTEKAGSVLVNGKHGHTVTSPSPLVSMNDTKESDTTCDVKDPSISPPSLTRRSSSNLSSLSSVSSRSPSLSDNTYTDKPTTTRVPDNLSLPGHLTDTFSTSQQADQGVLNIVMDAT